MVSVSPIVRRPLDTTALQSKLCQSAYGGVIITSSFTINCLPPTLVQELANIGGTTFVVGKKTAAAAGNAGFQKIIGEEISSTAELAPIVSAWRDAQTEEKPGRLIFPGAKKRARGLAKLSAIDEIAVYETAAREKSVLAAEIMANGPFDVVVFFSPSGVDAAYQIILDRFQITPKIVALGLTTAKSFPTGSNVCVSKKPCAEHVFAAIEQSYAYST